MAALAVGVVAGCTGSPPPPIDTGTPAAPTTAASATTTAPTSAPPTGTSTPASPTTCSTAELSASLGTAQGAAGSVIVPLVLTNKGGRSCTLRGFPGVSYVAGTDGHQVGPAAAKDGPLGAAVTLAPGHAATSQVRLVNVANFDAATCKPTPVLGLRVYPPDNTAALYVQRAGTGCAGTPPGDQIQVQTVTARS
jgi:Domain of unknown function (DUF4232)